MKIGIHAQPLSRQRTGIRNYILGLIRLLPQLGPQHEYFLYSNSSLDLVPSQPPVHHRIDRGFHWCPGALWLMARAGKLARTDKVSVFWSTTTMLPAGLPTATLKIVTLYDLVWLRYPETMTSYALFLHKMWARKAIADADLVIVISKTVQDELIHELGVPKSRTRLVYPGISERYKPLDRSVAAGYISNKYHVPPRYLATVGIVHPRKNLRLLVEVLRILKVNGQLQCPLLIVGPPGWKNTELFRDIKAANLTDEHIRFMGYMPDEDMPYFYSGAQIFLFPTLYEGFGLPPVEAMACGTPVIASDAPCMPEVLGSAAVLEGLTNPHGFAASIVRVLADEGLRNVLSLAGQDRAQRFHFQTSTQELLRVFAESEGANLQGDGCKKATIETRSDLGAVDLG